MLPFLLIKTQLEKVLTKVVRSEVSNKLVVEPSISILFIFAVDIQSDKLNK